MAEVFGIAAGAIGVASLSIQLAESLQKVKSFYAAAKNAPTQIEELIEEIEIMQEILSDLESGCQSANMASTASMRRCMKVAQRATKSFVAFSVQLQTRIKKSKLRGGVKFALSRDDIKEMLDQLERTKSSLNLAYSLFQQATAEDRHAALTSAVSSKLSTTPESAQNTVTLTHNVSRVSQRSSLGGSSLFRMTTPEWISNRIWQFEMRRSIAGFNIFLRTYGIVPLEAPIFQACRTGDTVEMQRLFDNRLASPFDQSLWDYNLWNFASLFTRGDSLRFLSQYDTASDFFNGSEMRSLIDFHRYAYLDPDREPLLGVGRRFREELIGLCDLYGGVSGTPFEEAYPTSHGSNALRLMLCSPEDADSIWFWQFLETAATGLNTAPSEETIKDMVNRYIPEHHGNKTPLQLAAVAIGRNLSTLHLFPEFPGNTRCLEVIIVAILATGAGLHECDDHHTPLLLFLANIPLRKLWSGDLNSGPRGIRRRLIVWLKILQRAGVDLATYGAEEHRHFLAYRSLKSPVPPFFHWRELQPWDFSDEVFHFNISYGPKPEDWTVQRDHIFDQYVGEFWQMPGLLDETERAVPGAWVDEV